MPKKSRTHRQPSDTIPHEAGTADQKRGLGWRPDLPDHRDHPYDAMRLPLEAPSESLPPSVDLRADCPPPYTQTYDDCTANAIVSAFQFDVKKQQLPQLAPSRLFLYYNQRDLEGTTSYNSGGTIRDGIKTLASLGVCPEDAWPYSEPLTAQPPPACYTTALEYIKPLEFNYYQLNNANIGDLKACLAAGNVFVFGFTLYPSFHEADGNGGLVSIPKPGEAPLGAHAVVAVGYDDGKQRFTVRSSWGPGVGDNGDFYMPYQYVTSTNLSNSFWTIRITKTG
jgi:C1A family cysteine protease